MLPVKSRGARAMIRSSAAKAADVVGLYMAPPENAIVICVDEKPSIQALERAQGYLKLPNGRLGEGGEEGGGGGGWRNGWVVRGEGGRHHETTPRFLSGERRVTL